MWKPKEEKMNYKPGNTDRRQSSSNKIQMLRATEETQPCCECQEWTNFLFLIRDFPLCESCYKLMKWTKYKTLSRKQATEKFGAEPGALHEIPSVKVPHPSRSDWTLRLFLEEDVKKLVDELGVRAVIGETKIILCNFKSPTQRIKDKFYTQFRALIDNHFNEDFLIDSIDYGDKYQG